MIFMRAILNAAFVTGCVTGGINAIQADVVRQYLVTKMAISSFITGWLSAWIIAIPISLVTVHVILPILRSFFPSRASHYKKET